MSYGVSLIIMNPNEMSAIDSELLEAEKKLVNLRKRMVQLRKQRKHELVKDYILKDLDGNEVPLSSLFGEMTDLILVHNMGIRCTYCTLWADGFNGVYHHLENRAAFALVSHDDPRTAKIFSEGRNWKFKMLANDGGDFTREMGYEDENGDPHPGISTFHLDSAGKIFRVAHTWFGPGDDFCSTWHIFDMLENGVNDWSPRFEYK